MAFLKEAFELFGWQFKRPQQEKNEAASFTPKEYDDGALVIAGGGYGTALDLDGNLKNNTELITKYRDMALHPEIENAVDDIINEAISIEDPEPIKIVLDGVPLQDKPKFYIEESFKKIKSLLDLNNTSYELFKKWYVDGRIYFHVIIDEKNPAAGIMDVRYIDPRKIRKIKEITKKKARGADGLQNDSLPAKVTNEYYVYNDKGFMTNKAGATTTTGLKIAKDAIVDVTSGLTNASGNQVLSYLHKAIKPLNQLKTLEDASIIYRLSRAPERRVWYVDVGNLPKIKAEQYVKDVMAKHKNRLVYDASDGTIRDDRKYMTMLEDFWLPTRNGAGTKVDTLPPGQNFNQIEDILYFQKKLYMSLHVPINRLMSDYTYTVGYATEISRDEIKFGKFISRLRNRFATIFLKLLEKEIVLAGIMSLDDWEKISKDIKFDYAKDNYFMEIKETQMLRGRIDTVNNMTATQMIGKYYSHDWVRKNVLKQSDSEIRDEDVKIQQEMSDPKYMMLNGMMPGQGMMIDPQQENQQS